MAGTVTAEDISSGQGKLHYMDIMCRVTQRPLFGHAVPSVGDILDHKKSLHLLQHKKHISLRPVTLDH